MLRQVRWVLNFETVEARSDFEAGGELRMERTRIYLHGRIDPGEPSRCVMAFFPAVMMGNHSKSTVSLCPALSMVFGLEGRQGHFGQK